MSTKKKMLLAAAGNAGGGAALNVEDVFSTYLYEGNGSTQTITNDIDLDGAGGMVWIKNRDQTDNHILTDTERGAGKSLSSNTDTVEATDADTTTSFNSDGFGLGGDLKVNTNGEDYASWTFRKAPKFFDVVTYTGTGALQTISHDLNAEVGCIIIKNLDTTDNWRVYHRKTDATAPENYYLGLDEISARGATAGIWNNTAPTSTEFTVNTSPSVNKSGSSFVAYLFAHNDGDGTFGPDEDQDIIKCGNYTGNFSSDGPEIDLGFEPQWVLIKAASNAGDWYILDNMRGISNGSNDVVLEPNNSDAEYNTSDVMRLTPTGFKIDFSGYNFNGNGYEFIYIAIRRGTKVPESGTEVFYPSTDQVNVVQNTGFDPDLYINMQDGSVGNTNGVLTRLISSRYLRTDSNAAETGTNNSFALSETNTFKNATFGGTTLSNLSFKRAPKFFDVVAYEGNGSSRTINHNLGVVPEMFIVKSRDTAFTDDWRTFHKDLTSNAYYLELNQSDSETVGNTTWNQTDPTSSVFTLGSGTTVNKSGDNYIAYLFASLDGVSKVGSYTGNGTSQTIDCGFDSGARFIMVKRADSTGDWFVWDSARGIVAGNESYLRFNVGSSAVSQDWVDPDNSGFIVNGTTINASSATYIFYAIA